MNIGLASLRQRFINLWLVSIFAFLVIIAGAAQSKTIPAVCDKAIEGNPAELYQYAIQCGGEIAGGLETLWAPENGAMDVILATPPARAVSLLTESH